jgi:hypothetical protein
MNALDDYIKAELKESLAKIEGELKCDVISIFSPILHGLDNIVREKIEAIDNKKEILTIILNTSGGVVEIVERMVDTIRHHYNEVYFIIPNVAMSAGTIFAMSGDKIFMDYFSCLGPIDPQIEKDGKLIPALSYIKKFEEFNNKALKGELTSAEYALLQKLDLAELHQFEQAKELSIELLKKWLTKYKFKDWKQSGSTGVDITEEMKTRRAEQIANDLSDNEKWHSHGRPLNIEILKQLKLKIDDYSLNETLKINVRKYYEILTDYMGRQNLNFFIQTTKET